MITFRTLASTPKKGKAATENIARPTFVTRALSGPICLRSGKTAHFYGDLLKVKSIGGKPQSKSRYGLWRNASGSSSGVLFWYGGGGGARGSLKLWTAFPRYCHASAIESGIDGQFSEERRSQADVLAPPGTPDYCNYASHFHLEWLFPKCLPQTRIIQSGLRPQFIYSEQHSSQTGLNTITTFFTLTEPSTKSHNPWVSDRISELDVRARRRIRTEKREPSKRQS